MEHQRGATLIEVLITLLILKIGLLGALAGQLFALKVVTDASQRTTAVALSHEIAQQLATFNRPASSSDFTVQTITSNLNCSNAAPCIYAEARQYLLMRWQQKWLSPNSSYGVLFAPTFCIQQQAGQLKLKASWRHHAALAQTTAVDCEVADGRSVLHLQ